MLAFRVTQKSKTRNTGEHSLIATGAGPGLPSEEAKKSGTVLSARFQMPDFPKGFSRARVDRPRFFHSFSVMGGKTRENSGARHQARAAQTHSPVRGIIYRKLLCAAGVSISSLGAESTPNSPVDRESRRIWVALGAGKELENEKNGLEKRPWSSNDAFPTRFGVHRKAHLPLCSACQLMQPCKTQTSCRELNSAGSNDRCVSSPATRSKS